MRLPPIDSPPLEGLEEDAEPSTVVVRGSGSAGLRHARAFQRLGMMPWLSPVRASRASVSELEGLPVLPSLAALPPRRGSLLVVVATDTSRHVADAREALQAGAHVLIEKPLAPDSRELPALAAQMSAARRQAFVGFVLRFDAGLLLLRRQLAKVGELHSVRIECQSYLPDWRPGRDHTVSYSARPAEGGVLRDLSHEIDYALWLFGAPRRVFCRLSRSRRLGIEADDGADLLWVTPAGVHVSLRLDYLTRRPCRRLVVRGSRGELAWDGVAGEVLHFDAGGETKRQPVPADADARMTAQARACLSALRGGDCATLATLADGVRVAALVDAAHRSAVSGCEEDVGIAS